MRYYGAWNTQSGDARAGSGWVAVRAIGGAWWRSVILPLCWWADRRMQLVHGGRCWMGGTAKYDFI
jgi:hypothetical protein